MSGIRRGKGKGNFSRVFRGSKDEKKGKLDTLSPKTMGWVEGGKSGAEGYPAPPRRGEKSV